MPLYYQRGSRFDIGNEVNVTRVLPVGTYQARQDPSTGAYYLDLASDFVHKGKIYGDTMKRVDRIFNTFEDRRSSTGVLLSGEKGSGKTLLAKMLSIGGLKKGLSTILVNSAFYGPAFNTFIQTIDQPCVIIFDEFEKVYDREQQDAILTLLDGTYSTQKLFIVTCNDKYRINEFMVNRPGRFFYALNYAGLTADFIREYCFDNLKDTSGIEMIVKYAGSMTAFNFDMLQAIVEDMNRYAENLLDVLKYLNVSATASHFSYDIVKFDFFDKELDETLEFNPKLSHGQRINIFEGFYVTWDVQKDKSKLTKAQIKDGDDVDDGITHFTFGDVTTYAVDGKIVAENAEGRIEFERTPIKTYNVTDYL